MREKIPDIKYKYIFEKNGKPTVEVDINKVTKRILYGDDYFGGLESDISRKKGYNGREVSGALSKLENGWLEHKITELELSNDPRDKMILEESKHPYTYIYEGGISNYFLGYFGGYHLQRVLMKELIYEVFYEKFGVELSVPVSNVNEVKGKQIIRRNKRK
jgi:hypothetical protein